ncbi:hypothetical protein [Tautonia sociabilis]|uniref:DUF2946 domain-containing protein n=1 Tax=Tautonia sociabilis TaxID=2080755 RepID=A0A432MBW6_9BACT|nr:hypothetical protein [Tautonia sociabilis]RUL81322.1 hypothetical protein TsocGM_25275 [Tautonia sociabilis]
MSITLRRIFAALLLASYGLISACGLGLHALVDDSHIGAATDCSTDGDLPSPSSPMSDHSDCLICHVAGQGQFLNLPEPIRSGSVAVGAVIVTEPVDLRPPDRLPGDPRAPPMPLA